MQTFFQPQKPWLTYAYTASFCSAVALVMTDTICAGVRRLLPRLSAEFCGGVLLNALVNRAHLVLGQTPVFRLER